MEKGKTDIDEILARHFAGEKDGETIERLRAWLSESGENRRQFEILSAIWSRRSAEVKSINTSNQETLEHIWKKGTGSPQKGGGKGFFSVKFFTHFPQIAAALFVVIIAALSYYWFSPETQIESSPSSEPVYITKENPAAQRSRFLLPDGSMVWLNCKSSLRYPGNFAADLREIELTGEAFFEVKKDTLRPFVVTSGNISTTALGTSFNVAAYPDKDIIEVALITGKVRIENLLLHNELAVLDPGLGIHYSKEKNQLTKKKVNTENVLAWKSGILVFDGDNYEDFVGKIRQWYDVDITTTGKVPDNWSIRGRFDNAYLTTILDVVSFNKDFNYQLEGKQLTLRFNKK